MIVAICLSRKRDFILLIENVSDSKTIHHPTFCRGLIKTKPPRALEYTLKWFNKIYVFYKNNITRYKYNERVNQTGLFPLEN